jgi:tRNA pseudouridine55 synthase
LRPPRPDGEDRPRRERHERPRTAPNRAGLQYFAALQADALAAKEHGHPAAEAAAPAPLVTPD